MKTTITCLLLTAAVCSGTALSAPKEAPKREADVRKDLESVVANCEKKKLPTEEEIKCIEKGYRQFMGEEEPEES